MSPPVQTLVRVGCTGRSSYDTGGLRVGAELPPASDPVSGSVVTALTHSQHSLSHLVLTLSAQYSPSALLLLAQTVFGDDVVPLPVVG
eukprot:3433544-Rhodomonas_salina.2